MLDVIYLAWRNVCFYRGKSLLLIGIVAVIAFLPASAELLFRTTSSQLRKRGNSTPLVLGAAGSPTDLVLSSLYFQDTVPQATNMQVASENNQDSVVRLIPLHVGYHARKTPIVGTSLDYFDFRGLKVQAGRQFGILGECVLGADVARVQNLRVGDAVLSSPENVFDLAGAYPLKLNIVGILESNNTPDDGAIFVDVKTTWVIAGLGHGHTALTESSDPNLLLGTEGDNVVASPAVVTYTEVTAENVHTFHFHGDMETFPLTSVLAVPSDAKSQTLFMGRFQGDNEAAQVVVPSTIVERLLVTLLRVKRILLTAVLVLGMGTLLSVALVFSLSIRLRAAEFATIARIGGSTPQILIMIFCEVALVLSAALLIASLLTVVLASFSETFTTFFLP